MQIRSILIQSMHVRILKYRREVRVPSQSRSYVSYTWVQATVGLQLQIHLREVWKLTPHHIDVIGTTE